MALNFITPLANLAGQWMNNRAQKGASKAEARSRKD